MAEKDVIAIIKKAVQDETFRLALSRNPQKALEDHQLELTEDELKALKQVDWEMPLPTTHGELLAAKWIHIYKTDAVA